MNFGKNSTGTKSPERIIKITEMIKEKNAAVSLFELRLPIKIPTKINNGIDINNKKDSAKNWLISNFKGNEISKRKANISIKTIKKEEAKEEK